MKHISKFSSTLFALGAALWTLPDPVAQAVRLSDGTIAFSQPPRLVEAMTPYTDANVWGTTYYFTLELPATAGEPLQKVTFTQTEGGERIRYKRDNSIAFEGTRKNRGQKLATKSTTNDPKTQTVTVTFDQPVPPGKTITIGLRPIQNPMYDGIYLFGVTAFPAGEQAKGQLIGIGRLQFYRNGGATN